MPVNIFSAKISVRRSLSSSECSDLLMNNAEVRSFARKILWQKIEVLNAISDDDYIRKLSSSSSIGAHIRHSLDHFNSVFNACDENAVLDYDSRNRNSENERVRDAAQKNCKTLIEKLNESLSDFPVMVKFLSDSSSGRAVKYASCISRSTSPDSLIE